jgi:phosphoglycerate dehydrogenase-like enzyme
MVTPRPGVTLAFLEPMDTLRPTLSVAAAGAPARVPAPPARPPALYLMEPRILDLVYGPAERARLEASLHFTVPPQTARGHVALTAEQRAGIEVIITSWGMPAMTPEFLALYPRLRAVFCGAGSPRGFVTDASWRRGVRIITAAEANGLPVAEYAFAQTILGLKRAWPQAAAVRAEKRFVRTGPTPTGTFGSTVGLLALGHIGRLMAHRLQTIDVKVLAYDPYVAPEDARALGVTLTSIEDLFARSDVVSCHLPLIPETEGMLRGAHFRSLQPGAVFINTARGEVVAEPEMIEVLRERPDLLAIIDVTDPEPPRNGSPLFELPNVFLTPHIAGSLGPECRRLGASIATDVELYVRDRPITNEVKEAEAAHQA